MKTGDFSIDSLRRGRISTALQYWFRQAAPDFRCATIFERRGSSTLSSLRLPLRRSLPWV